MISSFWIINSAGEVVIEKHYKGTTSRALCDVFNEAVAKYPKRDDVPPIITTSKFYLFNIYRNDLFFLASVAGESPPLFVVEFLHRIYDVFENYFGDVTAASVKRHFATVYQLLEELADNGLPLITEPNALNSLIAPPSAGQRIMQFVAGRSSVSDTIGAGALSVIPWRKTGVKYAQNEIYFDIVEEIDAIVEKNGGVIKCDVRGTINAKCHMTGTPDLTLVFNDASIIADASLHPCVRYSRFERERVVSFVPPDGKFKLLEYRAPSASMNAPIYLRPETRYRDGSGTVTFTLGQNPVPHRFARSGAGAGSSATAGATEPAAKDIAVEFRLPVVVSAEWNATVGTVVYNPKANELVWRIGSYPRDAPVLTGNFTLPPGPPKVDAISARLHFSVDNASATGISVRDVLIQEDPKTYKYYKGVRTFMRAGNFVVRS